VTRVEDRLSELLHQAAAPSARKVSFEEVARRARRRRVVQATASTSAAAALAVAVVAGSLGLVGAFGPPGSVAQDQATRFVDPLFGWTIRIPAGLSASHFQVPCRHGPVAGVRVTSFAPDLRAPSTGIPPMGWLRSFPADGVALQVWYGCWLLVSPPLRDSAFPLSPASFRRTRPYAGGNEPAPRVRDIYGNGFPFIAAVWIGPHASRAERHAIWAVVRSLRFPALREGTIYPAPRARRLRPPICTSGFPPATPAGVIRRPGTRCG